MEALLSSLLLSSRRMERVSVALSSLSLKEAKNDLFLVQIELSLPLPLADACVNVVAVS